LAYDYTRDGYAPAALSGIEFNDRGEVIGRFDNGRTRPLYRLALADFANPDDLGQLSGNVYAESETSGQTTVAGAGESGLGKINPGTLEKSNVDLAQEFGRMILTQNAYNSSATAFRTIDEMTEVARDLA
jgi:flagellar hook protein FlgE